MAGLTSVAVAPFPQQTPSPRKPPAVEWTVHRRKVKGTLLIARLKFVLSRGDGEAKRVLGMLGDDDRSVLGGRLLPSGWYPAGLLRRLEVIAALVVGGDGREAYLEMGRFTASLNLGPLGMQRPFVREGNPHFLLSNLPHIYGTQHGSGHRHYLRAGPSSAILHHFDTEEADPTDCLTTVGWLERAVAICGGSGTAVVERECRARGAPCCEFAIDWR
jgi:uncharacterized protein (TIGR02265 family)